MRRLWTVVMTVGMVVLLLTGCRPKQPQASGGASPPKVTLFLASPNPVPAGGSTSVGWAIEGGGSTLTCSLDTNGDGKPDVTIRDCPPAGSRAVTAAGRGDYRLTLSVRDASGHSASQTTTLRVGVPSQGAAGTGAAGTRSTSTGSAQASAGATPAPGSSDAAPNWTRTLASDAADTVTDVAAAADGNAVVVGYTAGSLEGASNAGSNDAFVAELGPDGKTRWLRQFGGSADDRAMAVALSAEGDVYVAGQTAGTIPGGSSNGSGDAFLVKLDRNGDRQWTRQFGTSGADLASGVAVGPTGNIFVGGDTNGTFTGKRYAGGATDAYVAKFDASGDLMWIRQFGGPGEDRERGLAVDASGDVVVAGFTKGALPTNAAAGEADAFVAKFDGNGQRAWIRQFGGDQADFAYAVAIAGGSDIVVAGDSYGIMPGGEHTGVIAGFAARFDANGNRRWLTEFGAKDAVVFPNGAAVAPSGDIVLSGFTNTDLRGSDTQPGYFQTFALELDPGGRRLWLRQFGRSATELKTGVGIDGQGRVTVVSTGALVNGGKGGSTVGSGTASSGTAGGASASAPEPEPRHVLVVQYPP